MIQGINHLTLKVRNLEVAERFYMGILGLKRVGSRPSMRFYSSGRNAHELALVESPSFLHQNNEGLMHLCFNVDNEEALRTLHQQCLATGIRVSEGVDHSIMHSFYMHDPDGYTIELGVDRPRQEWEHKSSAFATDRQLRL